MTRATSTAAKSAVERDSHRADTGALEAACAASAREAERGERGEALARAALDALSDDALMALVYVGLFDPAWRQRYLCALAVRRLA